MKNEQLYLNMTVIEVDVDVDVEVVLSLSIQVYAWTENKYFDLYLFIWNRYDKHKKN